MKKIPTLFVRDMTTRLVTPEITPGCEWVVEGAGRGTVKMDGTCCLVRAGRLYKRYEVKSGGTPPPDFEPADHDEVTGKLQGWRPVGAGPEDRWHREAWEYGPVNLLDPDRTWHDGTYELLGPKVQGNPEGVPRHQLVPHGAIEVDAPRTFDGLREWFASGVGAGYEGVVFHREDGVMCKIKGKDFGLKRKHTL